MNCTINVKIVLNQNGNRNTLSLNDISVNAKPETKTPKFKKKKSVLMSH